MSNDKSTYQIKKVAGGENHFEISAAPLPGGTFTMLYKAALFAFLGGMVGSCTVVSALFALNPRGNPSGFTFWWIVLGAAIAFYVLKSEPRKIKSKRSPGGSFFTGPTGIRLSDGTEIPNARIHRLVLRNPYLGDQIIVAHGFGVGGTAGAPGAAGAVGSATAAAGVALMAGAFAAGQALRRKQASVSYKLDVEHGGVATTLAGGMSETTANGLMQDVAKSLAS